MGTVRLTRSTPFRPTPASSSGPSTRPAGCASQGSSRAINRTGPCTPPLPPKGRRAARWPSRRGAPMPRRPASGADSDGTDAGEWPDPAARAPAGLHVARTPDRSGTGGPTRPVSVIRLSGGRIAARTVRTLARGGPRRTGKRVVPCRWRAKSFRQGRRLCRWGLAHLRRCRASRTGKGPDREDPMIVRHRPTCDRTYQW